MVLRLAVTLGRPIALGPLLLGPLLLGATILLHARAVHAYCRTSSCDDTNGTRCVPATPTDCGAPLFWDGGCLTFSMQRDASAQIDFDRAERVMTEAFAAWQQADCGGGTTPAIQVVNTGPVTCDEVEYNLEEGNANVVVFRDDVWPYAGQGNTLALTTVTFSLDSGEIFDADLEINATPQLELTTTDDPALAEYDLPSILTHEAGHMLGIAHSPVVGATMTVEYFPGDLELRSLHPDDAAAACDAYPPATTPAQCSLEPRRGFRDACGEGADDDGAGCSCRLAGGSAADRMSALPYSGPGLLLWLLARRRRRRRI
ncbi:MAG: matrixin family metalloprotease [Myxococcota bacterium]